MRSFFTVAVTDESARIAVITFGTLDTDDDAARTIPRAARSWASCVRPSRSAWFVDRFSSTALPDSSELLMFTQNAVIAIFPAEMPSLALSSMVVAGVGRIVLDGGVGEFRVPAISAKDLRRVRSYQGMLFQASGLFPWMSILALASQLS